MTEETHKIPKASLQTPSATASETHPASSQLQTSSEGGHKSDVFNNDTPMLTERDIDKTATFENDIEGEGEPSDQNEAD